MREADDLADEPGPTTEERRTAAAAVSRSHGRRSSRDPRPAGGRSDVARPRGRRPPARTARGRVPRDDRRADPRPGLARLPRPRALDRFCELVASTVGRVCVAVWGHDGHPAVAEMVRRRGLALQQTNVLRDLREDWGVAASICPRTNSTRRVSTSSRSSRGGIPSDARRSFEQVDLVEAHYDAASTLEAHLDPGRPGHELGDGRDLPRPARRIADAPSRLSRSGDARAMAEGVDRLEGEAGTGAGTGASRGQARRQVLDPKGRDDASS